MNQLSKFVHYENFLRRFDSSTNVPLSIFENCLLAINYIKASTLTEIKQVLEKFFYQKETQILYVLRNLAVLVAFY